jgi:hypothetical protein
MEKMTLNPFSLDEGKEVDNPIICEENAQSNG